MLPFPQPRSRASATQQNKTSASPTPSKENQCQKNRSLLTPWESRRFKSGGKSSSEGIRSYMRPIPGKRTIEEEVKIGTRLSCDLFPLNSFDFYCGVRVSFHAINVGYACVHLTDFLSRTEIATFWIS